MVDDSSQDSNNNDDNEDSSVDANENIVTNKGPWWGVNRLLVHSCYNL
jgi:hypothetical protein